MRTLFCLAIVGAFFVAGCSLDPEKDKWANFEHVEPPSGSVVSVRDTIVLYFDRTPDINIVQANNVRQHFVPGQLAQDANMVSWSVAPAFQGQQVELFFEWVASPFRTVRLTYTVR